MKSFLILVAALTMATARADLVSSWNFENNLTDSMGVQNGTLVNGTGPAPGYVSGVVGSGAISLNTGAADNQWVAVAYNNAYDLNTWTVSTWFNVQTAPTAVTVAGKLFYSRSQTQTNTFDFSLNYVSDTQQRLHGDVGNFNSWITTTADSDSFNNLTLGSWHMATYSVSKLDATTVETRIYLDGVFLKSITNTVLAGVTPELTGGVNDLRFGNDTGSRDFEGYLDDMSVWNNVLSDASVLSLYNLGTSSLEYGAHEANLLFDVYGSDSATNIGALTWYKQASGLAGSAGQLLDLGAGEYALVLDNFGGGVSTIPEPSSFLLVGLGLGGLLWRARRRA